MAREVFLQGTVILPDSVTEGHVELLEGEIVSVKEGTPPHGSTVVAKGIILPGLFNSHIHIGDSFLHPAPRMSVEELVGPPDGYKHRRLREADRDEIIGGITEALDVMLDSGTNGFMDFREGGTEGVGLSREAYDSYEMRNILQPVTLGRPDSLSFDAQETEKILDATQGLGLSAYSDWNYDDLKALRTKTGEKIYALHASERAREPIEEILELRPDMLIHMVEATEEDLELVKEAHVPVVLCARSNEFFGLQRDFDRLLSSGVRILGGTDNCMITRPQCLEEMRFILEKTGWQPQEVLKMFTSNPAKVLNDKNMIASPSPKSADLIVLDKDHEKTGKTHEPHGVLNYLSSDNISTIIRGETFYFPGRRM